MSKIYYFAYGSNINSNNIKKTCPSANKCGVSFLNGYKLSFMGNKGSSIACVNKSAGEKTPVVVWELDAADLKKLTNYVTLPYLYNRSEAKVKLDKQTLTGIIYVPSLALKTCAPSEEYLRILREGYNEHGLDENYIRVALEESDN